MDRKARARMMHNVIKLSELSQVQVVNEAWKQLVERTLVVKVVDHALHPCVPRVRIWCQHAGVYGDASLFQI